MLPVSSAVHLVPVRADIALATSIVFALSCLLPSIVGHILLLFTLIKTVAHIRAQQSTVVKTLQADQILFVLVRSRCMPCCSLTVSSAHMPGQLREFGPRAADQALQLQAGELVITKT
jgi:hypothetical protein